MAIPTNIIEKDIALASGDEELPALLAHPDSASPLPAVLMLHDIFGLRQLARDQAWSPSIRTACAAPIPSTLSMIPMRSKKPRPSYGPSQRSNVCGTSKPAWTI